MNQINKALVAILAIWMWPLISLAQALPEFPTRPLNPLDPSQEPQAECEKLVGELYKYNEMARSHDSSIAGFTFQVSFKMDKWHRALSPLEGRNVDISSGAFQALRRGAQEVDEVSLMVSENSVYLENYLLTVIEAISSCLP